MEEYEEDQIEFSILSVAKDPLPELIDQLAVNLKSLEAIDRRLKASAKGSADLGSATITDSTPRTTFLGPDEIYTLTRTMVHQSSIPKVQNGEYQSCSMEELIQHRQQLSHAQQNLRVLIREEQQSQQADDDYAEGRRYDYDPAVRTWLHFLARKKIVENLL